MENQIEHRLAGLLELALEIAVEAHANQRDKAEAPYILHPIRVMQRMGTLEGKIVAILHDVVEDCERWNFERLAGKGFPETILTPLRLVTKPYDDIDYMEFMAICAQHPVAKEVKLADLEDNMDLARIANPTQKDHDRLARYDAAYKWLSQQP